MIEEEGDCVEGGLDKGLSFLVFIMREDKGGEVLCCSL